MIPLLSLLACTATSPGPVDNGWVLVASDEFDGAAGEPPDPSKWVYDVGGDGWGNDQLEYDTDRTENAALDGDGRLVIRALAEEYQGNAYTSARLKTQGTLERTYGRFEARMQLPAGQGLWPAFWMLGADIDEVGWPACGEIDVVEAVGAEPGSVFGTVHGPGYSGGEGVGDSYSPVGVDFTTGMHTFAVEWDPEHIAFLVDEVHYQTVAVGMVDGPWVFDDDFFLILNLAVGGTLGGTPDPSAFPAELVVDHVRVYERAEPLAQDTGA